MTAAAEVQALRAKVRETYEDYLDARGDEHREPTEYRRRQTDAARRAYDDARRNLLDALAAQGVRT